MLRPEPAEGGVALVKKKNGRTGAEGRQDRCPPDPPQPGDERHQVHAARRAGALERRLRSGGQRTAVLLRVEDTGCGIAAAGIAMSSRPFRPEAAARFGRRNAAPGSACRSCAANAASTAARRHRQRAGRGATVTLRFPPPPAASQTAGPPPEGVARRLKIRPRGFDRRPYGLFKTRRIAFA